MEYQSIISSWLGSLPHAKITLGSDFQKASSLCAHTCMHMLTGICMHLSSNYTLKCPTSIKCQFWIHTNRRGPLKIWPLGTLIKYISPRDTLTVILSSFSFLFKLQHVTFGRKTKQTQRGEREREREREENVFLEKQIQTLRYTINNKQLLLMGAQILSRGLS